MTVRTFSILLCLISSFSIGSLADAAPPLIQHDFEQRDSEQALSGWKPFGSPTARLSITHDQASVKSGKGALEFQYEASDSHPAVAILPVTESLAAMQSIRVSLMSKAPVAVAVSLIENEGGRYNAIAWLEADTWVRVELTPEDFRLAENRGDPKDPNGKLDLDQIRSIGIVDISQIFNAEAAKHSTPLAIVAHTGPRTLFIDDFEVSRERPEWYKARQPLQVESFTHPHLDWFTFGGAELKLDASGKTLTGGALEATYEQMEDHFTALFHALPPMDLQGATHLAFDIASEKHAHLILSLEERVPGETEGPRYAVDFEVPGGGKAAHRELAFSAFEPDEHGPKDPEGKLHLDRLKSIALLDVTGAYTGETAVNTIHLGNLQAVKSKAEE